MNIYNIYNLCHIGRSTVPGDSTHYPSHNVLHLFQVRQTSPAGIRQEGQDMPKKARGALKNCLVLQRNFEACVSASKSNVDPKKRVR